MMNEIAQILSSACDLTAFMFPSMTHTLQETFLLNNFQLGANDGPFFSSNYCVFDYDVPMIVLSCL